MTETSSKTPASRKTLYAQFDALGIVYKTHDHAPVFTVEESAQIKADLPGGHTKNLFLKDKSGALFLVCALAETQVPVNKLHKVLGCKRLSFGKPDLLLEHLGVTPGSVTVFSVINDPEAKVGLVLDRALLTHEIVNFHPLKNDATTAIASDDLLKFVKAVHSEPLVLDFDALSETE